MTKTDTKTDVKLTNLQKLLLIQVNLKAPKGQFNKFGNYNYRSCEDIQESVKPLLAEYELILTLNDELVVIGDRYYVKATATIKDNSGEVVEQVTAYAREEETKKGMDGSQITGAASSYARKYALNALFLIDDTKDSDTTNTHDKEEKRQDRVVKYQNGDYKFVEGIGKKTGQPYKAFIAPDGSYIFETNSFFPTLANLLD